MTHILKWLLPLVLVVECPAQIPKRYLAFQIFTGAFGSDQLRKSFPPPPQDLRKTIAGLRDRIGTTGSGDRRLGFVVGPLSLDHTDDEVRRMIAEAFDIAIETNVAVGFHLDDSIFWGRRKDLNTVENIEWLDWNRTPNTGRRLDWSATPTKVMPQLCINSTAAKEAVTERAQLIGREIRVHLGKLETAGRSELFLGVIAGWETMIGKDFDTGESLGYCALTNRGFSADRPPSDIDAERSEIVKEFEELWARTLTTAGVPKGKVYSHIAFRSDAANKVAHGVTPPDVAFCASCVPGFSTYPQPGHLELWHKELEKHGNPPWASCEGTALDPGVAAKGGKGVDMEGYLGNLFNHGAQLVNVFGWGVGASDNPFRKTAENDRAIDAYRKFLKGEPLADAPVPMPQMPPEMLLEKVHTIQALLPAYVEANGPSKIAPLMERLKDSLKKQQFDEAAKVADEILQLIGK
jgi:hypothetical protein